LVILSNVLYDTFNLEKCFERIKRSAAEIPFILINCVPRFPVVVFVVGIYNVYALNAVISEYAVTLQHTDNIIYAVLLT